MRWRVSREGQIIDIEHTELLRVTILYFVVNLANTCIDNYSDLIRPDPTRVQDTLGHTVRSQYFLLIESYCASAHVKLRWTHMLMLYVQKWCPDYISYKILKRCGLSQKCFVSINSLYSQSLNTAVWYCTTIWPMHRAIDRRLSKKNELYALFCTKLTLPWYNSALAYCEIESLKLWRHNFQQKFFKQICHRGNCLHDLLPKLVSLQLRHLTVYPIPLVPTKRYCSFINYSLKYYRWQHFMFVIVSFHFIFYVYM